jgi:hypothetical protein
MGDSLASKDLLALARFGARVMDEMRAIAPTDLDGAWLQDAAEECGLLTPVEVSEPCDKERCPCAEVGMWPLLCYRRTDAAKVLDNE